MDTVQRVLPLLLSLVGLEGAVQCFQVCKSWRGELKAGGFCNRTVQLGSALVEGGNAESLRQNSLRRLDASSDDAERALCLDGGAFLDKYEEWEWQGSHKYEEWLQAASQEPDASFLSRGAASTAQCLGLQLVRWVGKPQGRFPGLYTLPGHVRFVSTVALSRDGKRAVSGSESHDTLVKIWNTETGAEVCSLE
jgi:WD40 repeat protein